MISRPFLYDEATHTYRDAYGVIPSITQLLALSGWVDDRWYTVASRERGSAVHGLTAQVDLGAVSADEVDGALRGYILAHVAAMQAIQADLEHVEIAAVHPTIRLAGRPDRVGRFWGQRGVLDEKSGAAHKSHKIQTALQAILAEPTLGVPPEHQIRLTVYLKANGRYAVDQWTDTADIVEARRIIRRYCDPDGPAVQSTQVVAPSWMAL